MIDRIIAYDANVLAYAHNYLITRKVPEGLVYAANIECFSGGVLSNTVVAVNEFMRAELNGLLGVEVAKNWLHNRAKRDLAVEVVPRGLPVNVSAHMRSMYSSPPSGRDRRYLETAFATQRRWLVSYDKCFRSSGIKRGSQRLDDYLRRKCKIRVLYIDCCVEAVKEEGWC